MFRRITGVILMALAARSVALAADAPRAKTATLENGMRVVVVENHKAPVISARLYVQAGSMYETDHLGAGMSHLLEHLLADTESDTPRAIRNRELSARLGGQVNAATTKDFTVFYVTAAGGRLDPAMELLAGWVIGADFSPEAFARERGVAQRELEMRRENPRVVLFERFTETMFLTHPARYPVIGYPEPLRGIALKDIEEYYRRHYTPNRMILAIAGDVALNEALTAARATFSKIPRGEDTAVAFPEEPPQVAPREGFAVRDVREGYIALGYRTIPLSHPDLYALDLAAYILGEGPASRLTRVVRDELGLVNSVACYSDTPAYDAGAFVVYAACAPDKFAAARDAIVAQLARLRDEPPTADEVARAKRQKIVSYWTGLEAVENQAEQAALDLLCAGDANFSARYARGIQEATPEQIQAAARKYFRPERLCVAAALPSLPADEAAPASSPAPKPEVLKYRMGTLSNGLRVIVKRNADLPLVSITAAALGGIRADPPGKQGLCHLTAELMMRGAGGRSAAEIAAELDAMGATMGAASGGNTLYVSAECLSENTRQTLRIMADVARRPAFPEEEFLRRRDLQLAAWREGQDDIHTRGMRFLRQQAFGDLPYAWDDLGDERSIPVLTREDVVAMHQRLIAPGNMVISVVGDMAPEEAVAMIKEAFGDMAPAAAPDLLKARPAPVLERDRHFRDPAPKETAFVAWAFPGMTFDELADRAAMDVLDDIISGARLPSGWLHDELRGKQLVYETHAFNWTGLDPGLFIIYALCQPEKAREVSEIFAANVARAREYVPTDEDLVRARQAVFSAYALEHQTNSEQGLELALNALYGLGMDFGDRYLAAVNAVTAADVSRVAKKYLQRRVSVVVGPELHGPAGED